MTVVTGTEQRWYGILLLNGGCYIDTHRVALTETSSIISKPGDPSIITYYADESAINSQCTSNYGNILLHFATQNIYAYISNSSNYTNVYAIGDSLGSTHQLWINSAINPKINEKWIYITPYTINKIKLQNSKDEGKEGVILNTCIQVSCTFYPFVNRFMFSSTYGYNRNVYISTNGCLWWTIMSVIYYTPFSGCITFAPDGTNDTYNVHVYYSVYPNYVKWRMIATNSYPNDEDITYCNTGNITSDHRNTLSLYFITSQNSFQYLGSIGGTCKGWTRYPNQSARCEYYAIDNPSIKGNYYECLSQLNCVKYWYTIGGGDLCFPLNAHIDENLVVKDVNGIYDASIFTLVNTIPNAVYSFDCMNLVRWDLQNSFWPIEIEYASTIDIFKIYINNNIYELNKFYSMIGCYVKISLTITNGTIDSFGIIESLDDDNSIIVNFYKYDQYNLYKCIVDSSSKISGYELYGNHPSATLSLPYYFLSYQQRIHIDMVIVFGISGSLIMDDEHLLSRIINNELYFKYRIYYDNDSYYQPEVILNSPYPLSITLITPIREYNKESSKPNIWHMFEQNYDDEAGTYCQVFWIDDGYFFDTSPWSVISDTASRTVEVITGGGVGYWGTKQTNSLQV
jgi:hypothetical protein